MKAFNNWFVIIMTGVLIFVTACSEEEDNLDSLINNSFDLTHSTATLNEETEQIVMTIEVEGNAGETIPIPIGQLDGATVFAYVFPTTLLSNDVGFGNSEGIVALALTSHPDFDDTPLWDENSDKDYNNDEEFWHPHWVLLVDDSRVDGNLSVKEFKVGDPNIELPPTNPGMPMYMDSPGYQVVNEGNTISVVIPTAFINNKTSFNFDAVTARLKVNTSHSDLPLLGVYEIFDVLSEDLSLPFEVR